MFFFLQLLQIGGIEVELSAGRKADSILVLDGRRTLTGSGRKAERRKVCRTTRVGKQHRKYRRRVSENKNLNTKLSRVTVY